MLDKDDYYAYKSTTNHSSGSGGNGSGGGKLIIAIVVIMLIHFIANGASWDAIDTLLGFGLIAYFLAKWLFS